MSDENKTPPAPKITLGQKIGRPIMWMGIGIVAFKILEVYNERNKTKRLAP